MEISTTATSWRSARTWAIGLVSIAALIVGAFVVATTLYGVKRFYSPIIWFDEWDGYLGFYLATLVKGKALHAWWAPHVEHRIITSRVLYWLDLRFFHGAHIIMFAVEQLSLAGIVAVIARAYKVGRLQSASVFWVIGIGAALMFSWVQSEVLKWGFETCVVLAYFFATCAAYIYTRENFNPTARLIVAFVFAALAEFSMGNGITAPLTIAVMAIGLRRPKTEIIAAGLIAVALVASYAIGYVRPLRDPNAVAPTLAVMAQFLIFFLGNPLYFIGAPLFACGEAGIIVLISACWIGGNTYLHRKMTPYRAFLLGVIVFVLASAAAAMIGRSPGGVMAAIESRYTTGPLLCWLALALLAFDVSPSATVRGWIMVVSIIVAGVMAQAQSEVKADNSYLYDWKLGVLGQRIGLDHTEYSGLLFPLSMHERFMGNADKAAKLQLGMYDRPWLRDAGHVKFDPNRIKQDMCQGTIDIVKPDETGSTVRGWAIGPVPNDLLIVMTDQAGATVGYGVTGGPRPDVTAVIPTAPATAGWVGFTSKPGPLNAYVYSNGDFCQLQSNPETNR